MTRIRDYTGTVENETVTTVNVGIIKVIYIYIHIVLGGVQFGGYILLQVGKRKCRLQRVEEVSAFELPSYLSTHQSMIR